MSPRQSPRSVRPVSIRKPKPISRTGEERTSKKSGPLSPRQNSPSERGRPELDRAIVLDNAEQSQPARGPGRAALFILGFRDELRIIDDRLAGVGWVRR